MDNFPGEGRSAEETTERKLVAIMFTDMVGYTSRAQQDEALAMELVEEHRHLLRPVFSWFNGREVQAIGDAFMIEFPSSCKLPGVE